MALGHKYTEYIVFRIIVLTGVIHLNYLQQVKHGGGEKDGSLYI
jgi:hypothetical protein